MEFTYCGSLQSDFKLIKGFIDSILDQLSTTIDNTDTLFDVRLILNELIINGVFHGNECDKEKYVKIDIKIKDNIIRMEVIDEGSGIRYDLSSYDPINLKCSGRGLVIVNGLSDEVIIKDNSIIAIKSIQ